jgi:ABC-type sugar transport system ATPase subunit
MTENVRLRMRNIRKSFRGIPALSDGNLLVAAGEVHALMGANGAGKSTMMNILGGVLAPDGGEIEVEGRVAAIRSTQDALRNGIAFVHQELTMVPSMTVAENVFIDVMLTKGGLLDYTAMNARAAELLAIVGADLEPEEVVETLSTGERQLIEIARALKTSPSIVILDEPTSSLSAPERERLFAVIAGLKARGTSVIFISHFLEEVFRVCDRVTVMRNGATVSTGVIADTTPGAVVHGMLGSTHDSERIRPPRPGSAPFLSVEGLHGGPMVENATFSLARGEIVGIWGLLGSGRTELVRTLMGLDPMRSGRIRVADGGTLRDIAPTALRMRCGFVTEDRREEGLILPFGIDANITLPGLGGFRAGPGRMDGKREVSVAQDLIKRLGIKAAAHDQPAGTLSGGNQQKVVFARWLQLRPEFYILDEPTRGLDTGAKGEILKLAVALAEEGASILMISSELEEIMRVADRYLILNRGRITGELPGDVDRTALMDAVSQTSDARAVA